MMNNDNQPVINPIEDQRAEALRHYEEVSAKAHHWSSFVADAIKAYNPSSQPCEGREQLAAKIKERMDLLPDDPVPSERGAYDAYLNCLTWLSRTTLPVANDVIQELTEYISKTHQTSITNAAISVNQILSIINKK